MNRPRHLAEWSLATLLLLFGCGTLTMDIRTDVQDENSISMQMTATATGKLTGIIDNRDRASGENALPQGWSIVEENRSGDSYTFRAEGTFTHEELNTWSTNSNDSDQPDLLSGFRFEVREEKNGKTFRISLSTESSPPTPTPEPDDPFAGLAESMMSAMADMFVIRWTVRMPGEITNTNGRITEDENEVTWRINLLDLQNQNEVFVESRVKSAAFGCNPT